MKKNCSRQNKSMNSPEGGKVLTINFISELFFNPFKFKSKFPNV